MRKFNLGLSYSVTVSEEANRKGVVSYRWSNVTDPPSCTVSAIRPVTGRKM